MSPESKSTKASAVYVSSAPTANNSSQTSTNGAASSSATAAAGPGPGGEGESGPRTTPHKNSSAPSSAKRKRRSPSPEYRSSTPSKGRNRHHRNSLNGRGGNSPTRSSRRSSPDRRRDRREYSPYRHRRRDSRSRSPPPRNNRRRGVSSSRRFKRRRSRSPRSPSRSRSRSRSPPIRHRGAPPPTHSSSSSSSSPSPPRSRPHTFSITVRNAAGIPLPPSPSPLVPPPPPPPVPPMFLPMVPDPVGMMLPPFNISHAPPPPSSIYAAPLLPVPPPPPPPPPPPEDEMPPGPSTRTFLLNRPRIRYRAKRTDVMANFGRNSFGDYRLLTTVGEGTYGKVFKAYCSSLQKHVAMKKVRLEQDKDGFPITAVREIKILRQLDHENVVQLLDVVVEGTKTEPEGFYLVFEYMAHDLHGLIESKVVQFNDEQVGSLLKQLLLGLEHCHSKNFLHRDIKCSNILLDNQGVIKLADFGLARLYIQNSSRLYTNRVITLWYRPPELLLGAEHYGPAVDIWSVGCILAELFTGKPIFPGQGEANMLNLISQVCGTPSTENWPSIVEMPLYENLRLRYYPRVLKEHFNIPSLPLDLLDNMLRLDPTFRPSATVALSHTWLQRIDVKRVRPPNLPHDQDCHEMWSKRMRGTGGSRR